MNQTLLKLLADLARIEEENAERRRVEDLRMANLQKDVQMAVFGERQGDLFAVDRRG